MKTALRILTYLISAPLIIIGALLVITTLIGSLFGSPREPPSGMTGEEFKIWTDSGRWFWESLLQGIGLVAIPLLAVFGVNRWTRK
jgi:hypothetical protein